MKLIQIKHNVLGADMNVLAQVAQFKREKFVWRVAPSKLIKFFNQNKIIIVIIVRKDVKVAMVQNIMNV